MKALLSHFFVFAVLSVGAQCTSVATIAVLGSSTICQGESVILSIDTASDVWTQKSDFTGMARKYAVGFSIDDKGYVGTGESNSGKKKDFWQYDPATDSWSQMSDFPGTPRINAVGFSIGLRGYLGTGNDNAGETSDFWEYNPATNTWVQKASFPFQRTLAVGLSIGNRGYIGMGGSGTVNDFWEYNPNTNAWTQKANISTSRYGSFSFSIGNRGYIGGGYVFGLFGFDLSNDFWEYNPATNTWVQKANLPNGYYTATAKGFNIGNLGYAGTGTAPPGNTNNPTNVFIEYNPTTNQWTPRANVGTAVRFGTSAFSIGGKGYMCGGQGNSFNLLNDLWEYTPLLSSYVWSNSDQTFTTTISSSGNYSVTLSYITGCTAEANQSILVSECTGLESTIESEFPNSIPLFPNPCSNNCTLFSNIESRYRILNSTGAVILELDVYPGLNTLKLGDLNAGIYFLSNGTQQQKIIKLDN